MTMVAHLLVALRTWLCFLVKFSSFRWQPRLADISCTRTGSVSTDTAETTVSDGPAEKLYECDTCGETFVKRTAKESHMFSVWGETLQMWQLWGRVCKEKTAKESHVFSVWGETLQMWHLWGRVCKEKTAKESHVFSVWGETLQMWHLWGRVCKEKTAKESHVFSVWGELYKCDICEKQFIERSELSNHICSQNMKKHMWGSVQTKLWSTEAYSHSHMRREPFQMWHMWGSVQTKLWSTEAHSHSHTREGFQMWHVWGNICGQ